MTLRPRRAVEERSVLVVDDDLELLANLTSCLRDEGFNVVQASDGIDALSYLYATRPDAVLVDLVMPRMNGVELIQQIRSEPDLAAIGVVAMSGLPDLLARAREAGANEVLRKPVDPTAIVRALRAAASS